MQYKNTNQFGAPQGDVPILRIDELSEDGKLTDKRIVAYGEATGHHHKLNGDCQVYEVERDIAGNLFKGLEVIVAEESSVELVHIGNDHAPIKFLPGFYFIPTEVQQVEYDGENERRVLD